MTQSMTWSTKPASITEEEYTLPFVRTFIHMADTFKPCGILVKTMNGDHKPCLCSPGHAGGHNPFSPNPFMLAVRTDAKK